MNVILPNRQDALGSNFLAKLAAFMWARKHNYQIFYTSDNNRWFSNDNMYIRPFVELCKNKLDSLSYIEYENGANGNHRTQQGKLVVELKQDLISHFEQTLKSKFLKIIDDLASKKNYILPWANSDRITSIHIRLSDNAHFNGGTIGDYDGRIFSNYVRYLIENDFPETFSQENLKRFCLEHLTDEPRRRAYATNRCNKLDTQCAIGIPALEAMILRLKNLYPKNEIRVVTLLSGAAGDKKYVNLCDKYNIRIHSNTDESYDLWLLMNSDVLVLSKSTFAIMAGYLHKGSKVYCPVWGMPTSCGLFTKYSKCWWQAYV